ncbi:DUF1800 domain-containing protein [Paraburkholderia unamae]|uniref:Uncharacterized protein (DUF1800 family) n=1 Tax=Paraburkholderia unamae TaxID=219649 RepID=A0ABX5KBT5_9BURK|nr:DUF1800 domain-containing protein [Paraburkholderia unamae]PVX73241.1 uncharacterized protein (DUF1800 family) [Paraburkholderia unamae]CAG9258385.1 conserved hypothetical protein [Paraburkholderia unamae]
MESPTTARAGAIAMNRFGLGTRADETPPADARGWLLDQFAAYEPLPAAWRNEPGAMALAARFGEERQQGMTSEAASAAATNASGTAAENAQQVARQAVNQAIRRESVGIYRSAVNARLASALQTETPFVERLVHFWSNHFAVSVDKALIAGMAGAFEMEAIRPHVLGNFADMLVAVEQHPAMQLFLDQTRSVGPQSRAALRADQRDPAHRRGLNENLAREIMELHTLGVRTGYTQDDVTEFARALTGWSVAGVRGPQPGNAAPGAFVFRPALHEPGTRTVMGKRYDEPGEQQALAILHDLAQANATSRHIAFQLARHFVTDNPPPDLTERLARAFEQSGGDLPTVYRAMVEAPQSWAPVDAKFKTPWEWTVSSMRGLGWREPGDINAAPLLTQLGQPVWRPGSPAGYDDIAASWAAPDALVRRVEVAQRFAARVGDRLDARTLGSTLMGPALGAPTATAVAHAESASTAIALLLVSPDFLRR